LQRDRDKAIAFYRQAIEAQPGAELNAALADRIAQLYAFFEDREQGVRPEPDKAAEWWKRCLGLTDPTQLLWAQAQMGLASAGVGRQDLGSSLAAFEKILELDPETIELDNWKQSSYEQSEAWRQQEVDRLRQRLRDLQRRARKKKPHLRTAQVVRARLAEARTNDFNAWTVERTLLVGLNALVLLVVVGVAAARYRKAPR
jgi:tetratricopeptide (TPR) repeat protein